MAQTQYGITGGKKKKDEDQQAQLEAERKARQREQAERTKQAYLQIAKKTQKAQSAPRSPLTSEDQAAIDQGVGQIMGEIRARTGGQTGMQTDAVSAAKRMANAWRGMDGVRDTLSLTDARLNGTHYKADENGFVTDVDMSGITSYDQLFIYAAHMKTDAERDNLLNAGKAMWGDKYGIDTLRTMSGNLVEGGVYDKTQYDYAVKNGYIVSAEKRAEYEEKRAEYEETAREAMRMLGENLYDANGNDVDVGSADPVTIIQSIRGIADNTERKSKFAALETLTKTPGSRFYGQELDPELGEGFNESALLTQSGYDETVDKLRKQLDPSAGHEQDNALAYYDAWRAVNDDETTNAYVKRQLSDGLKRAWKSVTGADAPEMDEIQRALNAQAEAEEAAQEEAEPEKKNLFARAWDGIRGLFGFGRKEDEDGEEEARQEPQEGAGAASQAGEEEIPAEVYGPAYEPQRAAQDKEGEQEEAGEVYGPAYKPQEAAGAAARAGVEQTSAEVYGPVYEPQRSAQGETDLTDDPITAIADYVRTGRGAELTQETQAAVDAYVQSEPGLAALYRAGDHTSAVAHNIVLGATLSGYSYRIEDPDFPQALRADAYGVMDNLIREANREAATQPEIYDRTLNRYETYIARHPQALNALDGAFAYAQEEKERAKEAARAADEAAKRATQALIDQARAAVKTGSASDEQKRLVRENAPALTQYERNGDEGYMDMRAQIYLARTLGDGDEESFYNQQARAWIDANGLDAGVNDAAGMQYKDMLRGYVLDALNADMDAAAALGFERLEDYYAAAGGGDMRTLEQRALAAMTQDDAKVTEQDVREAEEAAAVYAGTGEAGALDVLGTGVAAGATGYAQNTLTAVWDALTAMGAKANAEDVRARYTERYGYALGPAMYRDDMLRMAQESVFPDEAVSDAVVQYMNAGGDPYALGIDPEDFGLVRRSAAALRERYEGYQAHAQASFTPGQGMAYELTSGTTSNAIARGVSILGGGLLGGSVPAQILTGMLSYGGGFGVYQEGFDEALERGHGLRGANVVGMGRAVTMAAANAEIDTRLINRWSNALGIGAGVRAGMASEGVAATGRGFGAMVKAFAKGYAADTAGEVLHDEFLENLGTGMSDDFLYALLDATDDLSGPATPSAVLHAAASALLGMGDSAADAARSVIRNAGTNMLFTAPFSLLSGAAETKGLARSMKAVQTMNRTGEAGDAVAAMQAIQQDMEDPQKAAEYDRAIADAQKAREAARILLTDEAETGRRMDAAAEARRQANAHDEELTASQTRIQRAEAAMNEHTDAILRGNTDPQEAVLANAAAMDLARARQGEKEHRRERDEKRDEAERLYGEAENAAMAQAAREMTARRAAMTAMTREAAESAKQAGEGAYRQAEEGLAEAADSGDAARFEQIDEALERAYPTDALLEGAEASIGETAQEETTQGADYGTQDPVFQRLSSAIYTRTGVSLIRTPMHEGVRALYNRETGQLLINNRIGAGEASRTAVMHELTHYLEGAADYDAFAGTVLQAAYGQNEDARARDEAEIRAQYAEAGVPCDARKELVAAAVEKVMSGDEQFIYELLGQKQSGLIARLYTKVKRFLWMHRQAENREQYRAIKSAHDMMRKALKNAPNWTPGTGSAAALALDESGWPYVKADRQVFLSDDPKKWNDEIQDYIRDTIRKNGDVTIRTVDGDEIVLTEKSQWHAGSRNRGTSDAEYRTKLNASAHMDEVAAASERDARQTDMRPDHGQRHQRWNVEGWQYRWAYFEDYDGKLYQLAVSTAVTPQGRVFYNIGDIRPIQKNRSSSVAVPPEGRVPSGFPSDAEAPLIRTNDLDASIAQGETAVNPQITRKGEEYALAPRQFGNQTAQRSDMILDEVKVKLKGSRYESETNEAQLRRAVAKLEEDGMDATIRALGEKAQWNADDNMLAIAAMAQAGLDNDATAQAFIGMMYDAQGTEQARALQARKVVLRPEMATGKALAQARRYNEAHGNWEDIVPMGRSAPKKASDALPENAKEVLARAHEAYEGTLDLPQEVSRDNPWRLPLNDAQMQLIDRYGLRGQRLRGYDYNTATLKERMLAAIVATPNDMRGEGLLTLTQQLEAMKAGLAVVTEADLNYIAGQMGEAIAAQGESEGSEGQTQEGKIALARAYGAQANTLPVGFAEKFNSLRYMNMLSGTTTWARNIMSNVLTRPLEQTATRIAAGVDRAIAGRTGTRTTGTARRDERREGRRAFAAEIARTYEDYFIRHTDTSHGRKYSVGEGGGRMYQSGTLELAKNIVDFAMQIGDRPFYEQCYAEERAVIERLGMKTRDMETNEEGERYRAGPLREMTEEEKHAEATARALERVFQEDSKIIDFINGLGKGEMSNFLKTLILPFTKTPTNIATRLFQYSPAGLAKALLADGLIACRENGAHFDQRKFVMGVGRGLTGTGMILAGLALAEAGVLKFGREDEDDEKRRGVRQALGEPYGMYIEIGGQRREIDWALPAAAPLAMGASMHARMENKESAWDIFMGMLNDTFDEIFQNSYVQNINDLFRGYEGSVGVATRFVTTSVNSLMSQTLSPSFIRQIAKWIDPYARDTSDRSALVSALKQSVLQYWPGIRQTLPLKTDIAGDAMTQGRAYAASGDFADAWMDALDCFLSPTATLKEKDDAALSELLDLSYRTGETSFLPGYFIKGKGYTMNVTKTAAKAMGLGESAMSIELTDEEKRQANEDYARLLFDGDGGRSYADYKGVRTKTDGLRALIESPRWARMTDEQRVQAASDAQKKAKELITAAYARDR